MLRYIVVLISFIVFMSPFTYASRLALVIGNGDYLHESSLDNPVNDATDIAAVLKNLGFQVILKRNTKRRAMIRAVQYFGEQLPRHDVGLFYYSGHGLQARGENFLVPVDAEIKSKADIEFESVPANRILRQMEEANNGVNIVILDACRDNPFTTNQKGVRKGLAEMNSPTGSLIAFATAPNTSAWGGESGERNSIYTKHFLKALQNQAHLSITDLFTQVRKNVIQETKNETKQVPWESVSLTDRFCFGSCGSKEQRKLEQQRAELEQQRVELEQQRIQLERENVRQKEEARLKAEQEQQRAQLEREKIRQKEEARLKKYLSYCYTDNGDGTVTDNRSGLIWLKNANCFGRQNWETAMQSAANLASGQCGLRDGSRRGMWRLPTKDEWGAMIDEKYVDRKSWNQPALSNTAGTGPWKEGDAFSSVQAFNYWSSTTFANNAAYAWRVTLDFGRVHGNVKTFSNYVWPVRGGQ
ncbi:caspase family protein [Candidatus Parabeggiatoa sp. HSG14]|uniref:caspase family protein n=1 Tax=Candidatus Parabeggiatoa sp. HSG14 TaxID=3055593 RepID=UPI0025A851B3|nr:caspase family protein [Thiotrichales bacterium HSG14]